MANQYRLETHEDGENQGRLEIDRFTAGEEDIVFIEVIDYTVFDGPPQRGCMVLTPAQARETAMALLEIVEDGR